MNKTVRKWLGDVAVVGFGSQGRAQAIRLRDAGVAVTVGLPSRSRSRAVARREGFAATTPARAVTGCSTVALLAPDRVAGRVLGDLAGSLESGCLVVFAAGYPLHFPQALPPADCDIVLVAPHGPGSRLVAGDPMSGFVGVHQDVSGRALRRARAYARAIGLAPLYESTIRQEALGDLFGEQALLCGGLLGLTAAVAQEMIRRGIPPANAFYETTAQLESLSALLAERGVHGFWEEISDCAAAGSARAAPRLFGRQFSGALRAVWDDIESGRFARAFQRQGRPKTLPAEWRVLDEVAAATRARAPGQKSQSPTKRRRS
jgi:ketol-acid reductoisomerase